MVSLHKLNSTYFTSCYTHSLQHSLPSSYWWGRKDWEEKKLWVALPSVFPLPSFLSLLAKIKCIFPFSSIIIFNISGWLTQGFDMSLKKDVKRFLGGFCVLEWHFLLSVFKANSGGKGNSAFRGCQLSCLLSHGLNMLNLYLLWELLNSCTSWVHQNSVLMGLADATCDEASMIGKYLCCLYFLCLCACSMTHWISFAKHLVKDKNIKNSRQKNIIRPSVAILNEGSYVIAKASYSWSQHWPCFLYILGK